MRTSDMLDNPSLTQYLMGQIELKGECLMDNVIKEEEIRKLGLTISQIDSLIEKRNEWLGRPADELGAGEPLRQQRIICCDELNKLKKSRPEPYFGRVDFKPDSANSVQAYYIGKHHIPLDHVYSWNADIAALYYNPPIAEYTVKRTGNHIVGNKILTRSISIENSQFVEYEDLFTPGTPKAKISDVSRLRRTLSRPKSAKLTDIVETIQPDQYQQITYGFQGVIVVQGAAGSGKSEIGIHRLAYLLSPSSALNLDIKPQNVVLFGPSKIFLRYISNVLPGLDIPKIRQDTVFGWLQSILPIKVNSKDEIGIRIENNKGIISESVKKDILIAKLKGSWQMAKLIDKYIKILTSEITANISDISIENNSFTATVKKSQIIKFAKTSADKRLNEKRKSVLQQLKAEFQSKWPNILGARIEARIETEFNKFWPVFNLSDSYFQLLSNSAFLVKASRGLLENYEVEAITGSMLSKPIKYKRDDLPALSYLDHSLNNRTVNNANKKRVGPLIFAHVLIDEAQDISPLEIALLRLHSQNDSFTILGDLSQHILPHKGVDSWGEVRGLFPSPKQNVKMWNTPYSYRSTYEITKYAGKIIAKISPKSPKPIPFSRHGEKPLFIQSKTSKDMNNAIGLDVNNLLKEGVQTVAVLCKTCREAKKIHQYLSKANITNVLLGEKTKTYNAKVVVSTILASKGLEYDAVLLTNTRRAVYPYTEINGRLLYVGITRAAHKLHIHWYGHISEILDIPKFYHEPRKKSPQKKSRKQTLPT